uniref:AraC family transcriptional regulator n=1 Tax=Parerythrobacter lutipelagi TaxID=1964208 RepID=UPI0010F73064|nr:helix-turn-helix domain-containing protein [Parerythrobacter lutipelagi]
MLTELGAVLGQLGRNRLAMPPRFSLSYFEPPERLHRHVLALFHFAWDEREILDRHPGALGQLVLFPHGTGAIDFGDRRQAIEGEAHLLAGFSKAAPFTMLGPWHAVGVSLSPLGWAALTGRPKNECLDRFIPANELLGPEIRNFAAETNAGYRAGDLSGKDAAMLLTEWIEPRMSDVSLTHQRVIERTLAWLGSSLNPPIDELVESINYSRRQAERLVERYFGFPPAALARKYRAIRASALLGEGDLSDHAVAEIASAFHDQPHMVREIRRYCGYTPSRLGGPSDKLFQTLLRMKNFDRLHAFKAIK